MNRRDLFSHTAPADLVPNRPVTEISAGELAVRRGEFTVKADKLVARSGQVTVLLGENGAGKTTLLDALSGRRQPQSGTIRVDDDVVSRAFLRKMTAYSPAERIWPDEFRVRHVVKVAKTLFPLLEIDLTWQIFTEANIVAETIIGQCSSGEQRLIEMVIALLSFAPVCMIDEAGAHLDHRRQDLLREVALWVGRSTPVLLACQTFQQLGFREKDVYLLCARRISGNESRVSA